MDETRSAFDRSFPQGARTWLPGRDFFGEGSANGLRALRDTWTLLRGRRSWAAAGHRRAEG